MRCKHCGCGGSGGGRRKKAASRPSVDWGLYAVLYAVNRQALPLIWGNAFRLHIDFRMISEWEGGSLVSTEDHGKFNKTIGRLFFCSFFYILILARPITVLGFRCSLF